MASDLLCSSKKRSSDARSAESENNQLKSQLEKERKAKDEARSRLPILDNDFIITTRVKKGLKEWKFLQTKVSEKEKQVHSKHLQKYKRKRDELVEQMLADLPKLQSIFYGENSNAFDRKDKRRTTTGDMRKENRETPSLRSAESETNQMKSQLEREMKSKDETLSRLNRKLDESENEKVALKLSHKEEIGVHKEEIRKLEERLTIDKSYEERAKELKTKCDELETELTSLRSAESEINQMKSQLEQEMNSKDEALSRLNRRLDESENEKVALNVSHKEEIGVHKEEIRKLEERLTIEKSYEERAKELNRKCDELKTELARSEKKLKEEERENKTLKYRLEDDKRRAEEELKRVEAKKNQLTNQLENERKAKEDALLRLSSMASNKLRDNNPNIADLSDPNRPTKLSEQFSELYDNEWTDAFDELEKLLGDKKETEIISYLRDFVLDIHSVCSDLSFSKMKTIEEAFVKPSVPSESTKIPTEILKTIKDGIKSMAPKLLEDARAVVLRHLEQMYKGTEKDAVAGYLQHHNINRYIDKCTEVCWYMSVQDPQLVMDGSKSSDEKFDSNKHREYTKKGPYEEFVVWPVLYLYKGGQMLSKGVAQGTKKETIGQQ